MIPQLDVNPATKTKKEIDIAHLKAFMKRAGLAIADRDFADYIDAGDLIEIYNVNNIQIFRNLEFFRYTSYTIWDLVSKHRMDLHDRPTLINSLIEKEMELILSHEGPGPRPLAVPAHILREKEGKKLENIINYKYGWALNELGTFHKKAFLITYSVNSIGAKNTFFI